MALQLERISRDFAVIKAAFHHSEKLDKEETLSAQFTENTSAIKVKL